MKLKGLILIEPNFPMRISVFCCYLKRTSRAPSHRYIVGYDESRFLKEDLWSICHLLQSSSTPMLFCLRNWIVVVWSLLFLLRTFKNVSWKTKVSISQSMRSCVRNHLVLWLEWFFKKNKKQRCRHLSASCQFSQTSRFAPVIVSWGIPVFYFYFFIYDLLVLRSIWLHPFLTHGWIYPTTMPYASDWQLHF